MRAHIMRPPIPIIRAADTTIPHSTLHSGIRKGPAAKAAGFPYPHSHRHTHAAERKQARSAQRAAGTAQRLSFTPAAEKYTATT